MGGEGGWAPLQNISSLLPAPQISAELPVQGMVQSDELTLVAPLEKKLPQSIKSPIKN